MQENNKTEKINKHLIRNRRLSLFGHVARLDPEVAVNKALLLMVNSHEGRKPSTSWTRPPGRPRRTAGSTLSMRMLMLSHFNLYGELRFPGVMGRRNGPSGLREDDDDDDLITAKSNTITYTMHDNTVVILRY